MPADCAHTLWTRNFAEQATSITKHGINARVHGKRAKCMAVKAKAEGLGFHPRRPDVLADFVKGTNPVNTKLDTATLPTTATGYTATPGKRRGEGDYVGNLDELLAEGYTLIKWDGKKPRPLVSKEGHIFGVLVGQVADDSTWLESCQRAFEAMKKEGQNTVFSDIESNHCHGAFPAVNVGITMGFGTTYPTNLSNCAHTAMVSRLLNNPDIVRIANFVDATFNLWAPNLYQHYSDHVNPLFEKLPYLWRIFERCVFPTAAFNFGGNVVTKAHRDCMNSAIGWCAIIALGTFNPMKSGHAVFPDIKLIVEFPPGSVIFIPSATLTHGNLPVIDGERMSFTLYCSGGLFRYVDNGFRTESQLKRDDPEEYARRCKLKDTRWMEDLKLYSAFDDLVSKANL
ncbi:hypothetical protein H0H92_004467 [Tricholoma furcatifolium]|nr:hypothetical protein H0H92_004467 [Tricholoma furcatifolium]